MSTHAGNINIHGVSTRIGRIDGGAQQSSWHGRGDVKRHRVIRLAKSLPQIVSTHRRRTEHTLFRGLANQHQRALPLVPLLSHELGSPHQTRDVHIMTASVHDKHFITIRIDLLGP